MPFCGPRFLHSSRFIVTESNHGPLWAWATLFFAWDHFFSLRATMSRHLAAGFHYHFLPYSSGFPCSPVSVTRTASQWVSDSFFVFYSHGQSARCSGDDWPVFCPWLSLQPFEFPRAFTPHRRRFQFQRLKPRFQASSIN